MSLSSYGSTDHLDGLQQLLPPGSPELDSILQFAQVSPRGNGEKHQSHSFVSDSLAQPVSLRFNLKVPRHLHPNRSGRNRIVLPFIPKIGGSFPLSAASRLYGRGFLERGW